MILALGNGRYHVSPNDSRSWSIQQFTCGACFLLVVACGPASHFHGDPNPEPAPNRPNRRTGPPNRPRRCRQEWRHGTLRACATSGFD